MSEKANKENPGSKDSSQERFRKKEEEFRERIRKQEEGFRKRLREQEEEFRKRQEKAKEEAKKRTGGDQSSAGQNEKKPQSGDGEFEREWEQDAASPEASPFILNLLAKAREKASAYPGDLLFNKTERSHYTMDMMRNDTLKLISIAQSLSGLHDIFTGRIMEEAKMRNLRATEQRHRELIRTWYMKGLDIFRDEFSRQRQRLSDLQEEMRRVVLENVARGGGHENEPQQPGGGRQRPGGNEGPRPGAPDQGQESDAIQRVINEFKISRAEYDLIIGRIEAIPHLQFMSLVERVFGTQDREAVDTAYRMLAKKFHPDKGKTNKGERFKVLSVLYNEYKRRVGK
ncbi:MAG: hypothetical protein A3B10_00870 [Candidatus Doudnabacteria bacterium RIFCSPLOWO2_01_FULL_44_21]|uniref:J domain-containing protein n=1 Tax=Candidatus Doudnabacteria bacterium RIFCSPLOWO2_01_FULL_44_21 TaxID=1817841 RepID=A0A1F5PXE9_9BACT|nr:MAG: hypothetical protein A3B10_00870 [Candidatus Doudnabacteria bacterium RIFCSPLOWO2_01_FULL_44_21]